MKDLLAFEHAWLTIGERGDVSPEVSEQLAVALERGELPKNCLEWGYQRLKFTQYCGVIRLDGLQVEILPKLFPEPEPGEPRQTLLFMLRRAGELEELDLGAADLANSEVTLLDVFIRHFADLLERQLRRGVLRGYRETVDNQDQVRGRIDLVRQQRDNQFQPQRLACRFDELTPDITVNQLLHSALLAVQKLTTSPILKQRLGALRLRFAEVGHIEPRRPRLRSSDLDRLQWRYAPVVDWANAFLDRLYPDVQGGPTSAFSLLFDMNRLFERYVTQLLRPSAQALGLKVTEQGPRRCLAIDERGRSRHAMHPDITLSDEHRSARAILDAKWKLLNEEDPLRALSSADLYQVSTYAGAYRCPMVVLLFPEQAGMPEDRATYLQLDAALRSFVRIQPVSLNDRAPTRWLLELLEAA